MPASLVRLRKLSTIPRNALLDLGVPRVLGALGVLGVLALSGRAEAQLFENLEAFGNRLDVGDPATPSGWQGNEGPKGIAVGDLDGDGALDIAASNLDGTITVCFNRGGNRFSEPVHLATNGVTLREVLVTDLTGDGRQDIAAAALVDAEVVLLAGEGGGAFSPPAGIPTWTNARNLAAGDFEGDGVTDLVVAGSGLGIRQLRGVGGGAFAMVEGLLEFALVGDSRPVYSLAPLRLPGASRDEVVATNAWDTTIWILAAGAQGALEPRGSLPTEGDIYDLAVAPILSAASSGVPDLVTVMRDLGRVELRRGIAAPARFDAVPVAVLNVPGGPRAVAVTDLDGDGWNDLVVVLRYFDRVLTYRNEGGTLVAEREMPVGVSPRDLAAADFDRNGVPDLAVINRVSSDVSILESYPGQAGFGSLDQFYLVDGEVSDLEVFDFNGDGRDDVVQLHRASGDLSIRLAAEGGSLADPVFFPMGTLPNDMLLVDVNNDGFEDAVTANLGRSAEGSLSVRLGDGSGGLGEAIAIAPPEEHLGGLFAVVAADFDGDGFADLAAGYFDCRLAFFRGIGDGTFQFTSIHYFLPESRAMVSGDFDQDGDSDLAGASFIGHVVVVENGGDMLTADLRRTDYLSPSEGKFGTRAMSAADLNADGDLDLVVGSGDGVMILLGGGGMEFELLTDALPGTRFPATSVAAGDFDGDGAEDVAVGCRILSCITVLTQEKGSLLPALTVDVPAAEFLATGDLDGDGHADLVGSGEALWTAVSGRRASVSGPPEMEGERTPVNGVVINEVLAINNRLPLPVTGRKSDWAELFNGASAPVALDGWSLRYARATDLEGTPPRVFSFPPHTIPSGGHLVLVFAEERVDPFHTGFRLSGEGGTVGIFDAAGDEIDRVVYPAQRENVSFARYQDGLPSLIFNNYPSPGEANVDNGAVAPLVTLEGAGDWMSRVDSLAPPRPGEPIRLFARGEDDVGIVSLSAVYQRTDIRDPEGSRVILFDDGSHEDGAMLDGLYAGLLDPGLPAGAEIRLELEAEDLSGELTLIPSDLPGRGDSAEEATDFYVFKVGSGERRLELSEVVALNVTGLSDEAGGRPDWVEVRNCSSETVPLEDVLLGKGFPESEGWYAFPAGAALPPGEHFVVFCDESTTEGSRHAPFSLRAGGDRVVLASRSPSGALELIDVVDFGAQEEDRAFARSSCGSSWAVALPTPYGGESSILPGDVNLSGGLNITDAIVILNYLFLGGSLSCPGAVDTNGDRARDLSDAVYLLNHLFSGGPAPQPAGARCDL